MCKLNLEMLCLRQGSSSLVATHLELPGELTKNPIAWPAPLDRLYQILWGCDIGISAF